MVGGGLIRDSMGRWVVGFGRNIGCCLVLSAELWAVYDSLGVAWEAGIERSVEESDFREAIDVLKSQTMQGTIDLVDDIQRLLSRQWQVDVQYVVALCQLRDGCHGQGCKRTILLLRLSVCLDNIWHSLWY